MWHGLDIQKYPKKKIMINYFHTIKKTTRTCQRSQEESSLTSFFFLPFRNSVFSSRFSWLMESGPSVHHCSPYVLPLNNCCCGCYCFFFFVCLYPPLTYLDIFNQSGIKASKQIIIRLSPKVFWEPCLSITLIFRGFKHLGPCAKRAKYYQICFIFCH